eukprot:365384-Chlamydomonas_euryale.AAC.3
MSRLPNVEQHGTGLPNVGSRRLSDCWLPGCKPLVTPLSQKGVEGLNVPWAVLNWSSWVGLAA